jgi:hypothetical protein
MCDTDAPTIAPVKAALKTNFMLRRNFNWGGGEVGGQEALRGSAGGRKFYCVAVCVVAQGTEDREIRCCSGNIAVGERSTEEVKCLGGTPRTVCIL